MKSKRAINKRSIGSRVFNNFILIILLISIGFIFSLYERNVTSQKYDENTNINIKLSKLSLNIPRL